MTNTTSEHPSAWVPDATRTVVMSTATFGDRLVLIRRHLGLTQDQIAATCGMNSATWNTWEHGALPRNMAAVAARIAAALGVDREWLTWGPSVLDVGDPHILWSSDFATSAA